MKYFESYENSIRWCAKFTSHYRTNKCDLHVFQIKTSKLFYLFRPLNGKVWLAAGGTLIMTIICYFLLETCAFKLGKTKFKIMFHHDWGWHIITRWLNQCKFIFSMLWQNSNTGTTPFLKWSIKLYQIYRSIIFDLTLKYKQLCRSYNWTSVNLHSIFFWNIILQSGCILGCLCGKSNCKFIW